MKIPRTGLGCNVEPGVALARLVTVLLMLAGIFAPVPAICADEGLSAAANTTFLAQNALKDGTIKRPSGLQYRILRSGFGRRPRDNDIVHIAYSAKLINGALVDSASASLPASMAFGSISLRGLSEALSLMHEGDRWQLVIPANLAFGIAGSPNGVIPPNQTLVFDLTLISVASAQPGEAQSQNPFSVWSNGREQGAMFTIHP